MNGAASGASLRRMLFLVEGQIGDSLVLTPVIRAVKRTFPSARVTVLVVERYTSPGEDVPPFSVLTASAEQRERRVLGTNPHIDELLVVSRNRLRALRGIRRLAAEIAVVKALRRRRFDTAVVTWSEDRFSLWAFLSGARIRVGQRKGGVHLLLTHRPTIDRVRGGVLRYCCDLVRELGVAVESEETEYVVPESERRLVGEVLRAHGIRHDEFFAVVHAGATADYKIWPPERFAAVVDHLILQRGITIVVCEGPLDRAVTSEVFRHAKSQPIRVKGMIAGLLERAGLCISNDSGPRHIAVALKTPSMAFARQFHDREWGVYAKTPTRMLLQASGSCPACADGRCRDLTPTGERYGAHCMRMISTEQALEVVDRMLGVLLKG